MRTNKRFIKATAVVLIMGLGLLHNAETKNIFSVPFSQATVKTENNFTESDTLQVKESQFISYTRTIIRTGFEYIISNL